MNRWLLILFLPFILGFTEIYPRHDTEFSVSEEFANVYDEAQARQFTVYATTPALSDLRDGEIVILSSNTYSVLIWRTLDDLWKVQGSCITVRR